jgi:hypothetical protein
MKLCSRTEVSEDGVLAQVQGPRLLPSPSAAQLVLWGLLLSPMLSG